MTRAIWRITWFIILCQKFTNGCSIEDLRKNNQILLEMDMKDSVITVNSILNVKCINDVNEVFEAEVKCSKQDEWDIPLTCSKKNCSPLVVPKDMKVKYSVVNNGPFSTGTTAAFSCTATGLFLSGSDTLTCTSSGTWSNPVPQCVDYVELFLHQGENVTLMCKTSATSNRCHLVNWFFEDELLQPHLVFQNLIIYRNTLQITKVNELSMGRYVCTCFNLESESAPTMTFDVNLFVTEKQQNSLLILNHKSGSGSSPKRNHEKQHKRNRKAKLKYRQKQKNHS